MVCIYTSFDDGNGRITRALTDMMLARSENTGKRFYSMSAEIKLMQKSIMKYWKELRKEMETLRNGFFGS